MAIFSIDVKEKQETGNGKQGAGNSWLLAVGCWLLAVGKNNYQLLNTTCCQLYTERSDCQNLGRCCRG